MRWKCCSLSEIAVRKDLDSQRYWYKPWCGIKLRCGLQMMMIADVLRVNANAYQYLLDNNCQSQTMTAERESNTIYYCSLNNHHRCHTPATIGAQEDTVFLKEAEKTKRQVGWKVIGYDADCASIDDCVTASLRASIISSRRLFKYSRIFS